MSKLTDRDFITGESQSTDLMHVVRGGNSWKAYLGTFLLNNSFKVFRDDTGNAKAIIFRSDPTTNGISNTLYVDDICVLIDDTSGSEALIVGLALDTCTANTTDLRDGTKFLRFIDNSALL